MSSPYMLLVNACRRTRPITRALGLRLSEQRRGTQFYSKCATDGSWNPHAAKNDAGRTYDRKRGRKDSRGSGAEEPGTIRMMNAHGAALDVCIRTAEFLGRYGTSTGEFTPHTRKDPVAVFLGEDRAVHTPSLAFAVEGPLIEHCYYPDMLITSGFEEVRSKNSEAAAGFAAAISRLCSPHQVLIVLVPPESDRETLTETAKAAATIAGSLRKVMPTTVALSDDDYKTIAENVRSRGASTAETERLMQAAHAAYVRGADAAVILEAANGDYDAPQLLEYYERLSTGNG
ncbi:MAG: hypothetical protein ACOCZ9_03155 [Spirochaetota bacterium]